MTLLREAAAEPLSGVAEPAGTIPSAARHERQDLWNQPIQFVKGVGPKRTSLLQRLGIATVEDALWTIPWRYEDRSVMTPIGDLVPGMAASICGTVAKCEAKRTRNRRLSVLEVGIEDETGRMQVVFFNQPYLEDVLAVGKRVMMSGRVIAEIRQVDHTPSEPATAEPVTVTAKITDPNGVAAVTLQYQIVDPGNYISISNTDYSIYWFPLSMRDDGLNGDAQAGDSVYSVVLPGTMQQHRRLVRYRIQATDQGGSSITVPYPDHPQPNFAYCCYDGVPAWQAALRRLDGMVGEVRAAAERNPRLAGRTVLVVCADHGGSGEDHSDATLVDGLHHPVPGVGAWDRLGRRSLRANMASIAGQMGNAGQVNYSASKGGQIAFTKSSGA